MFKDKQSFFQKLTGGMDVDDEEEIEIDHDETESDKDKDWSDEDAGEGQLTVDVYQTPEEIVIKTMVAGVKPDDLDVSITRDMVTIKGKREELRTTNEEDYFHKELYWGAFSRAVLLPNEIEPEEATATEKHGLLVITLPKIDKGRSRQLKVKSS